MKAYSLLYLSLFSFAALSACKPSRTAQTEKMKEMEKKELKMLEEAKPEISESEGDTIEDYYGTSREGLINWVLTDTATLSYPFTRSIEKTMSPLPPQTTTSCAFIHGTPVWAEP